MSAQENFIMQVANEINRIITNNLSCKIGFQEQIKNYLKMNHDYSEAFIEHLKKAESNPQWKNYADGTPPFKNWKWHGFYKVWVPEFGFVPAAWVSQYYRWNPFNLYENPTEPSTQNERLMCEYAVLAAIHDKYIKDLPSCDKLYKTDKEEYIPDPGHFTQLGEFHVGEGIRNNIQLALDHVKADLAEKQEGEREPQQGKIGFLSELTPEEPSEQ